MYPEAHNVPAAVLSEGLTYQTKVVSAKLAGGNAAKTELQASIDNLQTEFQEKMDRMGENVDRIEEKLISIERTCAIIGPMTPLSSIIFQLSITTADIRGLSDDHLRTYHIRYVGPVGNRLRETQFKGVFKAIGATQ
ncbi:hypothetical protein BYT27DRAFT_7207562 [Phlegmacium glaucopus]|nr:hypothetical protein BYT27DRAFT_7207562 [Phlegmacium glaucopus]